MSNTAFAKKTTRQPSTRITVLPPMTRTEREGTLVSKLSLERLPFWSQLDVVEQTKLAEEIRYLIANHKQSGVTKLEIKQRLFNLKTMLVSRRGAFRQLLDSIPSFGWRTGFRYVEDYEWLLEHIKRPVLEIMIENGFTFPNTTRKRPLGDYTEAYHALVSNSNPPPEVHHAPTALRWMRNLEIQHVQIKDDPRAINVLRRRAENGNPAFERRRNSYDFMLSQLLNLFKGILRRLPPEQREPFTETFVGYALTLRGVASKTFAAVAIPDTPEYKRKPGRPKQEILEAG